MLDPLELVGDDDGAAELAVFEGAGVGTTCVSVLAKAYSNGTVFKREGEFEKRDRSRIGGRRTLRMRNEHIPALIHGPQKAILEVCLPPPQLPNITPTLPLRRIHQRPAQLGRIRNLPPPNQLLPLHIPAQLPLALHRFRRDLVKGADLRHVPAPESKVGEQPEHFVLGAAGEAPDGLVGLRGEVLDGDDELDVWEGGAGGGGDEGAVEGGEGCDGFFAVDVVDEGGFDDVELLWRDIMLACCLMLPCIFKKRTLYSFSVLLRGSLAFLTSPLNTKARTMPFESSNESSSSSDTFVPRLFLYCRPLSRSWNSPGNAAWHCALSKL